MNIFGGNTGMTYDELQRKRAIADKMLEQNTQTPRNVGEGLSAIGRALAARAIEKRTSRREAELKAEADQLWTSVFGVGGQPSAPQTYAAPSPAVSTSNLEGEEVAADTMRALGHDPGFVDWNERIRKVETGGEKDPWAARGPVVPKGRYAGERAIGPNQIMPGNVAEWGAAAGIDPQWRNADALASGIASGSPEARAAYDAIVQNQYQRMKAEGLYPTQMANKWFTGSANPNPNISDGYTTAGTYAQRFGGETPQSVGARVPGVQAIAEALSNPYIRQDPGKVAILQALLQQQLAPPAQKYQVMTGAQLGLGPDMANSSFNVSPDGRITQIGGGGTSMSVTNNLGDAEADDAELRKKLAGKEGELWATYLDQGGVSAGTMADMEMLEELIAMAPQGPIQGRLAQAFPGVNSAADAFQSIVKRVAPTLRAPGSGSTSDIEYDGMLKALPQLSARPEANAAIAAMMKAKASINIQRAEIVAAYQNEEISTADARKALRELDKKSIMTPELKAILGGVASEKPPEDYGGGWGDVGDGVQIRRKQ